jgi:heterodisulfide reductase subunit A-like polyferredoxin
MAISASCKSHNICQGNCTFGAIIKNGSANYIDRNICAKNLINCLPCAKSCPEEAIKIDYEYQ